MYLKVYKAENKDGSIREYLQIVETKRSPEKRYPQQRLLLNVARLDGMDKKTRKMLFNLARGILKMLGEDIQENLQLPALKKLGEKRFWGLLLLCEGIWKKLGLQDLCHRIYGERRIQYPLERALFAIVVARLYGRGSELSISRWIAQTHESFSLGDIELHQLYRSLEILEEQWFDFEDTFRWGVLDLFHQQVQILFIDTTSVVYWGAGDEELCWPGYSKQKRGDKNQLIIGVALVNGLPIGIDIQPGNTADIKTMGVMLERFRERFDFAEVCIVCDAGMVSLDDIRFYHSEGWHYLVKARGRENIVKETVQRARSNPEGWEEISTQLTAQRFTVALDKESEEELIVVRNEVQEVYEREVRERILKKLGEKEGRDIKELIKNRGYRRYLDRGGRIRVNDQKVKEAALWDGIWVIRTNHSFNDLKEAIERYKELWQVERAFRDLKNLWHISPVFHRQTSRIKGHIYACFLSLLLGFIIQRAARELGLTMPFHETLEELKLLQTEWIAMGDKKFLMRDELKGWQKELFKKFKIPIPAAVLDVT